ncbi:Chemotaxis protein [Desulfonema limicola]|uniref:Chemotaxis protein n=1 Tax=Desulfonema limicola TaxID=45656 RepID=A0A975B3F4_9BACT|nr:response regulator [Desulfonema limicola]QTA78079.1 Chemotaxis protein [Desulfonema limicola]
MYSILIADDSWLQRQLISNVLKGNGYELIEAKNGRDAVDRILKEKPDCMILDLLMPDMDGLAVLRFLKEKGLSIPVIVLSADIQNTTRIQCFELGVVDFLNKPAQNDELLKAVQKALQI